jgi:Transglycosylase SLT domain
MGQTGSIPATAYSGSKTTQPTGFGQAFGWIDQKFNEVMKSFDHVKVAMQGTPELKPQNMFQGSGFNASTAASAPFRQNASMGQSDPALTSSDCAKIKQKVDPKLYQQAVEIANKVGIDSAMFVKQLYAESSFKDLPANSATAKGIAQITQGDRDEILRDHQVDAYSSVYNNMLAGAYNMKDRLKLHNGDYRKALAAYNAGEGALQKALRKIGDIPMFRETRNYIARIMGEGKLDIA